MKTTNMLMAIFVIVLFAVTACGDDEGEPRLKFNAQGDKQCIENVNQLSITLKPLGACTGEDSITKTMKTGNLTAQVKNNEVREDCSYNVSVTLKMSNNVECTVADQPGIVEVADKEVTYSIRLSDNLFCPGLKYADFIGDYRLRANENSDDDLCDKKEEGEVCGVSGLTLGWCNNAGECDPCKALEDGTPCLDERHFCYNGQCKRLAWSEDCQWKADGDECKDGEFDGICIFGICDTCDKKEDGEECSYNGEEGNCNYSSCNICDGKEDGTPCIGSGECEDGECKYSISISNSGLDSCTSIFGWIECRTAEIGYANGYCLGEPNELECVSACSVDVQKVCEDCQEEYDSFGLGEDYVKSMCPICEVELPKKGVCTILFNDKSFEGVCGGENDAVCLPGKREGCMPSPIRNLVDLSELPPLPKKKDGGSSGD